MVSKGFLDGFSGPRGERGEIFFDLREFQGRFRGSQSRFRSSQRNLRVSTGCLGGIERYHGYFRGFSGDFSALEMH